MLEFRFVGESCRTSTLRSQFYFLTHFIGTREEKEFRSNNQEQEDIDGTGEVEYCFTEKSSRRRYVVVSENQPPSYGEREDDERVCQGVTDDR